MIIIKSLKGSKLMSIVIFVIYLFASVGGMLLVKLGSDTTGLGVGDGVFSITMPWYSIVGMFLYIMSFLLWMYLINTFNLSYISPMSMGISQVLILLSAAFILHEEIFTLQWIGIFVVMVGVALINIKR